MEEIESSKNEYLINRNRVKLSTMSRKRTRISDARIPVEISESLLKHHNDFPENTESAFIMMRFGKDPVYKTIVETIRDTLRPHNIVALRADDKYYHAENYWNIITYLHFCKFGIAIFDRIETDEFNPNVSLEIGYLSALQKPLLILKDKTIKTLPTDLISRLYHEFDTRQPKKTLVPIIKDWVHKNMIGKTEPLGNGFEEQYKTWKNDNLKDAALSKKNLLDERIKDRLLRGKTNRAISEELGVPITRVYDIYLLLKAAGHFDDR